MREFGYSSAQMERFVEVPDIDLLMRRVEKKTCQHLYWFVRGASENIPTYR